MRTPIRVGTESFRTHDKAEVAELFELRNRRAALRNRDMEAEVRLIAVEERHRPGVAYHDALTRYEHAVAAVQELGNDETELRGDRMEQTHFWLAQTELHGKRLAEEQVVHDMRDFDLDTYRRGMERKYALLAQRADEYAEGAPELREMAFLKQKMRAFAERMKDPHHQRRLRVERDRSVMRRTLERTGHAVARLEATRKTLNWFNPFHWKQIVLIDKELDRMRGEMAYTNQKYLLATTAPVESEIGIRLPESRVVRGHGAPQEREDAGSFAAK